MVEHRRFGNLLPHLVLLAGVIVVALIVVMAGGIWYNARLSRALSEKNDALAKEVVVSANLKNELDRSERLFRTRLAAWQRVC